MWSIPFCLALVVAPCPVQAPAKTPAAATLFANEQWYKDHQAEEKTLEGVLMLAKGDGKIGMPERFNGFRLTWLEDGKPVTRLLFTNGNDHLLASFQGGQRNAYTVKITGKLVDEVGGKKTAELWPARIEVVGEVPYGVVGDLKIVARQQNNLWYLNSIRRDREPRPFVFRDGKDVATSMGYQGPAADTQATQYLASSVLGIANGRIDWNKHMAICLTAGIQTGNVSVEITRVAISESGGVDVFWKLSQPAGATGNSYPITTILVPKMDGEITFFREGSNHTMKIAAPEPLEKPDPAKEDKPR